MLLLASAVFALAHLTLGFALSAMARAQIQAIQAAVFFYLPVDVAVRVHVSI